jgi:5,10-methylenetetrahydromethanopterin reductase
VALSQDYTVQKIVNAILTAENKGCNIVFITDEGFSRDPYSLLATGALITQNVKLGVGVTNPYTRHPGLTAAAIATIDEISNGRAILGLGAGSFSHLREFGLNHKDVISTLRETVIVIRKLLNGEGVTARVARLELSNTKLHFSLDKKIPIYIAGRGPQILKLAGEIADGAIVGAGLVSADGIKYALNNIKIGAAKADRRLDNFDVILWTFCSIADDAEIARDSIRPIVASVICDVHAATLTKIGVEMKVAMEIKTKAQNTQKIREKELRSLVTDNLINQFSISGTPFECTEKIRELIRVGVKHIGILPVENPENDVSGIIRQFYECVAKS